MTVSAAYPRVLLVSSAKIKADDPAYLLVRTEFGDWPKERLAQIFASDDLAGQGEFCGRTYQLGAGDRLFGRLFRRLRGQVSGMVAVDALQGSVQPPAATGLRRWVKAAKKRLGDWLISSGVWEVLFHVRVSPSMAQFVETFHPDLIYCQGYSLGFSSLPLMLSRRFDCPICFQTTDDWPAYTYRASPVGWLLRRRARQLVLTSKVRMAFGEKMRQIFEARYQVPFLVTYHSDQAERFRCPAINRPAGPRTILFTGNLGLRRYEAIGDLLEVIRSPDLGDLNIEVRVYTSGLPKEVPESLRLAPEIRFLPLPSHEELPSVLAAGDVLFLPESFSVEPKMIDLSVSTKCHLYMLSGRPVLVYGPPYCGTVDYAYREGWAVVVRERSSQVLGAALVSLLSDEAILSKISQNAGLVAVQNHDLAMNRASFLIALNSVLKIDQ